MSTPASFFDPRMRGFRDRAEVVELLAWIDRQAKPLDGETVPLARAVGRVLAQSVVATVAVPGFDRAAMDGYAVQAEETFGASPYNPLELALVGESLPGQPYSGHLMPGQAVRIMTGSPVPSGADAVIPVEQTEARTDRVRIHEPIAPGRHIGRRGEDISPGQEVLAVGRRLRPQDLGLLASIGVTEVNVVRRPRVAVLITGNELLPAGSRPQGHRIVDSNSPMLSALITRDGGEPIVGPILRDDRDTIRSALEQATADVLLICGGSSVGKEDYAPSLISELGRLAFHGLALRPASPTGAGLLGAKLVFLLPGNPVSCLCAYDLFASRAVRVLGGRSPELPYPTQEVTLASKIVSAVGRVDYVRLRLRGDQAEPIAVSGASQLSTTTLADAFLLVPRDLEGYAVGDRVTVYLYDLP